MKNPRTVQLVHNFLWGGKYSSSLEEITVGRDSDNVFYINPSAPKTNQGEKISRRHCVISQNEEGVYVWDVGSRNGTYVNGSRLEKGPGNKKDLSHGDVLSFSDVNYEVRIYEGKLGLLRRVVNDIRDNFRRL